MSRPHRRPDARIFSRTVPPSEYDGRPGVVTYYARSRNAIDKSGERVVALRYSDTDEVRIRHCRGNDARLPYLEYHAITYAASFDDLDVAALALQRLRRNDEPVVAWCARCSRPMQAWDEMCSHD